jgi:hypothetical protein
LDASPTLSILIIYVVNLFGAIGFNKNWFNVLFGINLKLQLLNNQDLEFKEILLFLGNFFFLIFLVFWTCWLS